MRTSAGDAARTTKFGDRQVEMIMGRLLQAGVMLASLVVLLGGVLYVRAHHNEIPNYQIFSSEPADLKSVRGAISGIATGDPGAIILLGILLLVATPVARVAFAVVAFAVERDRLYVVVSLTVLAVLLGSLAFSR